MSYSKNRIILIIVSLLTISAICRAQYHPQYSQYMFNELAINPAYAGAKEVLNLAALYRSSQLGGGTEGAPVTQTLAGDFPLQNPQLALGMMIFNDRINITRQSGAYLAYAFRVRAGEGKLSFGLQAGFDLQNEDETNIFLLQPDDPMFKSEPYKTFMPNVGAGTFYYTPTFFAGLSFPQFLKYSPLKNGDYKPRPTVSNFMLYGGTIFQTGKDLKVKPTTLLQYAGKGILLDVNCNVIMLKDRLELGASWRSGSIIVAMAQFRINSLYIGYAYDYAIGKPGAINTSHEIMLRYDLRIIVKAASPLNF